MNESKIRIGDWIQTYSGRKFYPLDPLSEEIHIEDIAHALSLQCRYGGHCLRFYSVAEHSWLVSFMVPREDALAGLLHDAQEAYVIDVPRPLKRMLQGYDIIEANVWYSVSTRFGLNPQLPLSVKLADEDILYSERRVLMAQTSEVWRTGGRDRGVAVSGLSPPDAEHKFLERFHELTRMS